MILVADSGSTKTSWAEVESGRAITTEGLNPHFTTDERFLAALARVREALGEADRMVFYGAGLGDESQRERYLRLLNQSSTDVHPRNEVFTDMLGACRAVCRNEAAIVGILGTGSNCCHYDGDGITLKSFSTGYILGDHGSANHVGRLLLQDYLTGEMPERTAKAFGAFVGQDSATLVTTLYGSATPNRMLAQMGRFAAQNTDDEYCCGIIADSLEGWYKYQLKGVARRSGCEGVRIVGSFGKALEPMLASFLERKGLRLEALMANPIEGLIAYHRSATN